MENDNTKKKKNISKLDYDYGNNYSINIINNRDEPKNEILPRLPRRLNPIKK